MSKDKNKEKKHSVIRVSKNLWFIIIQKHTPRVTVRLLPAYSVFAFFMCCL